MDKTTFDFPKLHAPGVPPFFKHLDHPHIVGWKYDGDHKPPFNLRAGYQTSIHKERARSYWADVKRGNRYGLEGVGVVLTPELNLTVLDLDDCFMPGTDQLKPQALNILNTFTQKTYIELSPSKHGLHIFALGKLPGRGGKVKGLEAYDSAHYSTITGYRFKGSAWNVHGCQSEIDASYTEYFGDREENPEPAGAPAGVTVGATVEIHSDDEAIRLAKSGSRGQEFARLLEGQPLEVVERDGSSRYLDEDGELDESRVEYNLSLILARVKCPAGQIDRIYRGSELWNVLLESRVFTNKWEEERNTPYGPMTYGALTILKAMKQVAAESEQR